MRMQPGQQMLLSPPPLLLRYAKAMASAAEAQAQTRPVEDAGMCPREHADEVEEWEKKGKCVSA